MEGALPGSASSHEGPPQATRGTWCRGNRRLSDQRRRKEQRKNMWTSQAATIRPARLDDYEGVCRLMDSLDAFHQERLPWMFKVPSEQPRSEAYFADLLHGVDSALFVADV